MYTSQLQDLEVKELHNSPLNLHHLTAKKTRLPETYKCTDNGREITRISLDYRSRIN